MQRLCEADVAAYEAASIEMELADVLADGRVDGAEADRLGRLYREVVLAHTPRCEALAVRDRAMARLFRTGILDRNVVAGLRDLLAWHAARQRQQDRQSRQGQIEESIGESKGKREAA